MDISVVGLFLGLIIPGAIWVTIGIAVYFFVSLVCRISPADRIRQPGVFSIPVILSWPLIRAVTAHAVLGSGKNQASVAFADRHHLEWQATVISVGIIAAILLTLILAIRKINHATQPQ
jgi:hypothetical protein